MKPVDTILCVSLSRGGYSLIKFWNAKYVMTVSLYHTNEMMMKCEVLLKIEMKHSESKVPFLNFLRYYEYEYKTKPKIGRSNPEVFHHRSQEKTVTQYDMELKWEIHAISYDTACVSEQRQVRTHEVLKFRSIWWLCRVYARNKLLNAKYYMELFSCVVQYSTVQYAFIQLAI